MTITEVYKKYKIMPSLQLHQLRVAGVAKIICDNFHFEVDTKSVLSACLLHDMGNILKFNLGFIPQFLEPKGLEYWQKVKDEFKKKYGDDEHYATYEIAKEIGVTDRVLGLVQAIGFSKSEINIAHNDYEKKIACYADHRVIPYGVTSLEERMNEGRDRFKANKQREDYKDGFEHLAQAMRELEKQVFFKCKIKPEDITNEVVIPIVECIREFEITNQ